MNPPDPDDRPDAAAQPDQKEHSAITDAPASDTLPADAGEPDRDPTAPGNRAGFVALIGAPNAGKSTLVNALVGAKVSIVTHKVQTTRAIVRGIFMAEGSQVILVDTPGIFDPRRRLDRAMVKTAWSSAYDADHVCLLIDARRGIDPANAAILEELTQVRMPKTLILTKIDLVDPPALLKLAEDANKVTAFGDTFMISAQEGSGVADVREHLAAAVPAGPWLYPEDQISDIPMRQLAAEITREQLTLRLHDELPYSATVETETWKTLRDGSARIEQAIFVEREGQKKIVIGEKGATIRAISMAARQQIASMSGAPVHLFLFVKVRPKWTDDPERYREMGLDYSK
ncbi:GTPase Era [Acuticoccus sp. MNP-M23]|uniref:GTPase Era n=1 Tax=Acuticoccus sp. MNP-M23 TaxID=3072793 RepID=UPI002815E579|nr:GTPase Era [Acuticoccus sp. MNP-M23]WMS43392.1 GTPase Era [Acuticoccus sp. MNP-M23]